MPIYLTLIIALILVLICLRKRIPIGPSVLVAGLFIWAMQAPQIELLGTAVKQMLSMSRTYDLLFALYFVVCLEIELRKSGCLKGMVRYLDHLIHSSRVTLAVMPAFLGLLPSIGGARFSAPIVDETSKHLPITQERKAAINFWFRHIFEFASPIVPGMILACSIAEIGVGDLIIHLAWASAAMFAIGWLFFIRTIPKNIEEAPAEELSPQDLQHIRWDFWLSVIPVFVVFALMVFANMSAGLSMGIVAAITYVVLMAFNRGVSIRDVVIGAMEWRLIRDVCSILFFIQLLDVTGVLNAIVSSFQNSILPPAIIIAAISFVIGILTGISQGHVAIVMPLVAAMMPGSLDLAGVALVFGVGGQMITPTHVCLIVTLDYFKSDFFKTLWPVILAEVLLLALFSVVTFLTWG